MKVVLNRCYGGFGLSKKAYEFLGESWDGYGYKYTDMRKDEKLIKCVEELGTEASGFCANLEIVEIPDNSHFVIDEYDGYETIYYSESEIKEK